MLLLGVLIIAYSFFIEPNGIIVKRYKIESDPFSSFFNQYKTVLLSDIHVSQIGYREKQLLKEVNKIAPDYIFFTGDLVAWRGSYEAAFKFLNQLEAKIGVIGVLGDSDYRTSHKACNFCHDFDKRYKNKTAKILRNQSIELKFRNNKIQIIGVEAFKHNFTKSSQLIQQNQKIPKIILSHMQINLTDYRDQDLLLLCGNTHGGQIIMPDTLWQLLKSDKGDIRKGIQINKKHTTIVTSGVGYSRIPFRLLCPPEIVLLTGRR